MLLSAEKLEEREKDGVLPVEDSGGGHVEGVNVKGQDREEVREESDGHACTCKAREADEPDEVWQDWP